MHIFVRLVKLSDNIEKMPADLQTHLREVIDYLWSEELSHFMESTAIEINVREDADEAKWVAYARGELE